MSLAKAYPIEQARLRELIKRYRELPNGVGTFGAIVIEEVLKEADEAVVSQDLPRMIAAFKSMKECE